MWFSILLPAAILVFGFALSIAVGVLLWERAARKVRNRLEACRVKMQDSRVNLHDLDPLPEPVRKYFRAVLEDGQPKVAGARILHRGQFNMSETGEKWKPFLSRQAVTVAKPGFDWEARIRLAPGISILVRDAYAGGEGILKASLAGLFTVAEWPPPPNWPMGN